MCRLGSRQRDVMALYRAQKKFLVIIILLASLVTLMYLMANSLSYTVPLYARNQKLPNGNYSQAFDTVRRQLTRQTLTKLDSRSSFPKPSALETGKSERNVASASEFTWKTLADTLSIYSSYYDTRHFRTSEGVFERSLVIFGYEVTGSKPRDLWCVVILDDNSVLLVEDLAVRISISEQWTFKVNRYRGFSYRCNVTMLGNPRYVTLSGEADFQNMLLASFIPVVDPRPTKGPASGNLHKFGVCFGSPFYGFKYDQRIVDSIEMNRLLGATWFTIYIYEAHEKAMQILRYYHKELKILDAIFNWAESIPNRTYYRGQMVGVNDCVYRNMYKVRYLVRCDLDELIMPLHDLDWHELMVDLDARDRGLFIFRHLGFHKNRTQPTKLFSCPGKSNVAYELPPFLATHNRSVSVISGYRLCKSIAKPEFCTSVQVHLDRAMVPGYKPYYVPTNIAVMEHFRGSYKLKYMPYGFTLDYGLERFRPALLAAVEKHYCRSVSAH